MSLVIVNTRVANLASVDFAFRRLGVTPIISADPEIIRNAERVVLPGVGTAAAAMRSLHGLALVDTLRSLTQPMLGVCLGMQMLTESSDESASGRIDCLGVIPGSIERMTTAKHKPLPHMGWNQTQVGDHPLFAGLQDPWFYYVHSYAAPVSEFTIAKCEYTQAFSGAIARDNFMGVQFHPERSGSDGARVLKNFLELSC
ncbi:imidazole glycerol phosphate synthase subunit HisH [Aliidiomarina indica]|uniref:imidazole glycerol phosphate synthase subunit HisH n=1 Tax=Aliidiomarina indica TaxID=2749147 RepID=UPI0018900916|nr:imidazole glycerol phosphate synthase subunit HisH [Aliidiomarina indica]